MSDIDLLVPVDCHAGGSAVAEARAPAVAPVPADPGMAGRDRRSGPLRICTYSVVRHIDPRADPTEFSATGRQLRSRTATAATDGSPTAD